MIKTIVFQNEYQHAGSAYASHQPTQLALPQSNILQNVPFAKHNSASSTGLHTSAQHVKVTRSACVSVFVVLSPDRALTPAGLFAQDKKKRHTDLREEVMLHEQLKTNTQGLVEFLKKDLQCLPLSICLIGNLFKSDPSLTSMAALIQRFRVVKLRKVDESKDPERYRHYYGLVRSVLLTVQRMWEGCSTDEEREDALALLVAMSVLPGNDTPTRPFQHSKADLSSLNESALLFLNLFQAGTVEENGRFDQARKMLQKFGLVKRSNDEARRVGNIHNLVQKCVWEEWGGEDTPETAVSTADALNSAAQRAKAVVATLSKVLEHRIDNGSLQEQRDLASSCESVAKHTSNPLLLQSLGDFYENNSNLGSALATLKKSLALQQGGVGC